MHTAIEFITIKSPSYFGESSTNGKKWIETVENCENGCRWLKQLQMVENG